jgi:hypothetical protein
MAVIEAILAVIGLVLLLLLATSALSDQTPDQPPEDDLAAPYRQGLQAAVRMQGVAQDLEQQLYAEALRHAQGDSESET